MRLASVFGHMQPERFNEPLDTWPLPRCNIGLEWEFEVGPELRQKVAAMRRNSYLSVHDDGSLRDNGVEVVTAGDGLYGRDLQEAINLMHDLATSCRIQPPVCNYRTGFHVHVDIRDMEETELHNMLLLYCLVEKPIFNFVGQGRWKSNFCVPWFRSDAQFTLLRQIEQAGSFSKHILDGIGQRIKGLQRYSALNCQAIAKLGTLEFRHMENNVQEIRSKQVEFIKIVMSLKKAACRYAAQGLSGVKLFNLLKDKRREEVLEELQIPLLWYTEGWDFGEALMLAIGLVNFPVKEKHDFIDLYFDSLVGRHPNWR